MRGRVIVVSQVVLALVLAGAPAAVAKEATPSDVWSAAASLATATIYRPSQKILDRLKVYSAPPQPDMTCVGEWNVAISYEGNPYPPPAPSPLPLFDLYQSTKECQRDGGGSGVAPNPSSVMVGKAKVVIRYWSCFTTPEGQDDPEEGSCPAPARMYTAWGTLAAKAGKKPTSLDVLTRGLSRSEVAEVIASLRVVR